MMIIIIVSAETDRLRNHKSPYFRQTDFQGPLALINRKSVILMIYSFSMEKWLILLFKRKEKWQEFC